jgi:hypothetical protein
MSSLRRGILELAALRIQERRRRITPAGRFVACVVCGERLQHAVELMARRHAGCQPRPLEETGR